MYYYRRRAYDRRRIAVVAAVAAAGVLLTEAPLTDQSIPPYQAVPPGFLGTPLVRTCTIDPTTGYGTCAPDTETIVEINPNTGQLAHIDGVRAVMTLDPATGRIISVGGSLPTVYGTPAIVDGPGGPGGDW